MIARFLLLLSATTTAANECSLVKDFYGPCCGATDKSSVDLDAHAFCDKNAGDRTAKSLRHLIRSQFTENQLASWNLTGTTLRTAYPTYQSDVYPTALGMSGKILFNHLVVSALTGATYEFENSWACGPHYGNCDVHFGWFASSSRVASVITPGLGATIKWNTETYTVPYLYVLKTDEADVREKITTYLQTNTIPASKITVNPLTGKWSTDLPYLVNHILTDAGYIFVHHSGSACTDNVCHPTAGNLTCTDANSKLTTGTGGAGAYDIDQYNIIRDLHQQGIKAYTANAMPETYEHISEFTRITLDGFDVVACTTYEQVGWVLFDALGQDKSQRLLNAIDGAKHIMTKAAGFFTNTVACSDGAASFAGTMMPLDVDMTDYCDTDLSEIFLNAPREVDPSTPSKY